MARRLIAGESGAVLVVLLAGVAYLASHIPRFTLSRPGVDVPEDQASRRSVIAGAALARGEQELEVVRLRARVDSLFTAAPASDSTTLAVLIDADGWRGTEEGARVARMAQTIWREHGLGATKVAVGVVVIDRGTARRWGRALQLRGGELTRFFVLPDSLTPSTCLTVVVAPYPKIRAAELHTMEKEWLGPCAYYARFGLPGSRVRQWLSARGFDLALAPDWSVGDGDKPLRISRLSFVDPSMPWYWRVMYIMPPHAVGCLAGHPAACRVAIRDGDREEPREGTGRVAVTDNSWSFTQQRLLGGDHFLGAVVRDVGPRRFAEFWRSPLPVDSSLTVALREPVADWTAGWQGRITARPRFGPGLRLRDLVIALFLSATALGAVLWASGRREVT